MLVVGGGNGHAAQGREIEGSINQKSAKKIERILFLKVTEKLAQYMSILLNTQHRPFLPSNNSVRVRRRTTVHLYFYLIWGPDCFGPDITFSQGRQRGTFQFLPDAVGAQHHSYAHTNFYEASNVRLTLISFSQGAPSGRLAPKRLCRICFLLPETSYIWCQEIGKVREREVSGSQSRVGASGRIPSKTLLVCFFILRDFKKPLTLSFSRPLD